jgi:hypothetical protein
MHRLCWDGHERHHPPAERLRPIEARDTSITDSVNTTNCMNTFWVYNLVKYRCDGPRKPASPVAAVNCLIPLNDEKH